MSPAYGYMDGYPHRSSQSPCMQQYQPWRGSVPAELRVDPSKYPVMQGWPCIGGHHNHPATCHACHNYMAIPSCYSFPPPCPPMFQPQLLHYWGAYPGNPQFFPVQQVPSPGFWVERPKYEYDKNAAQDHYYCGCPNHVCKPNEEKGIKIEEQEPNIEFKGKDLSGENNSSVPIHMKNYPYPILWVSPELMKNFEGDKLPKQRVLDSKYGSYEMERGAKSVKKEPTQNSWFPLKRDHFTPSAPASEQKRDENQEDGGNKQKFPFPIIWMPSYDKQEEEVKEKTDDSLRSSDEAPSTLKVFPLHPYDSRDNDSREVRKNKENRVQVESGEVGELLKQNIVKDVKSCTNKNLEDTQGTDFSDKRVRDQMSTPGSKEKSSSSTKASKLPPVCLRVDPLSTRKSGRSRSPSPPDPKRGSSRDTSSILKDIKMQDLPLRNENSSKDMKEKEEGETGRNTNGVESMRDPNLENFDAANKEEDKIRNQGDGSVSLEHTKAEVVSAQGKKMETCSTKKSLSEVEAARLIQSAYRGYEVRRWDSLKKLKQMAGVQDEVVKIRKSIDTLKSGNEDLTDHKRLVISESIMRVLLQLDSIQGLHPSLRDIRKSLARELVYLQSELDSLASEKSDEFVKELPTARSKELRSHDVSHQQDEQTRETDIHLVQAPTDENGGSRQIELEETQHHQCDSVCNESLSLSKVEDAMQDKCAALYDFDSGEGEEKGEWEASAACSKETFGDEHTEKLRPEVEGLTGNQMELMPTTQIDSELPMPLMEGKDKVDSGGVENETISSCFHGKEDMNDTLSESAPHLDGMDPLITVEESKMDVLAKLPIEIAAEEIHEPRENMKHEEADARSHPVLGSCDSSSETIEQVEASKETTLDGNMCAVLQPQQPEVLEASLEGSENIDAVPVQEDDSAEQLAKMEAAFEDNVGFDGTDTLNDAYPKDPKEILSSVSEVPVKDSKEDPKERCEEQEPVDAEATRESEDPEEKVVLVAHDQFVPGNTSELSSQDTRVDSCKQGNAVDANKLIEENEKLREMMEKLMEAGKDQLDVISDLTGRVKDLESKLARTKKMRTRRCKAASMRSRHAKLSPDSQKKVAGDVVM